MYQDISIPKQKKEVVNLKEISTKTAFLNSQLKSIEKDIISKGEELATLTSELEQIKKVKVIASDDLEDYSKNAIDRRKDLAGIEIILSEREKEAEALSLDVLQKYKLSGDLVKLIKEEEKEDSSLKKSIDVHKKDIEDLKLEKLILSDEDDEASRIVKDKLNRIEELKQLEKQNESITISNAKLLSEKEKLSDSINEFESDYEIKLKLDNEIKFLNAKRDKLNEKFKEDTGVLSILEVKKDTLEKEIGNLAESRKALSIKEQKLNKKESSLDAIQKEIYKQLAMHKSKVMNDKIKGLLEVV